MRARYPPVATPPGPRPGLAGSAHLIAGGLRLPGDETGDCFKSTNGLAAATGLHSRRLAAPLGMNLPVYPVNGCSITADITDEARASVSTVMDESCKVAITRLGNRIRVGGLAGIAGFDLSLNPRRRTTLEKTVGALFTGGGGLGAASFWCGLRPMTPDGTPPVGASTVPNLRLNTGHGTLGWTMAAGSGRSAEIDSADLGYARYLPPVRWAAG